MKLLQIFALQLQVRCPLACSRGNSRDVVHFCEQKEIFVIVRLVHEKIVNAELFEEKHVVFLLRAHQLFELLFLVLLDALEVFDGSVGLPFLFPCLLDTGFDVPYLFPHLADLPFGGDGDLSKGRLRDQDAVPIAERDLRDKPLAVVFF